MGHAGSTGSITLDVYSKTWWEERVDAVTRVVEAVLTEPDVKKEREIATPLKANAETARSGNPFGNPRLSGPTSFRCKLRKQLVGTKNKMSISSSQCCMGGRRCRSLGLQ